MSSPLLAGFAQREWTPAPGLSLLGQMHPRIATHARDPLCACASAWVQEKTVAVVVTMDTCLLDESFIEPVQQCWAEKTGLPASSLLIHATHTHVAPPLVAKILEVPDADCVQRAQNACLEAGLDAWKRCEPVEVFAATGHLDQLGWNRRALFEDGLAVLYGHSQMPGFVGMEGPRDPDLPVLWTKNAQGRITGVIIGFATHPNCLESQRFYSADLPGAARHTLQRLLGDDVQVLYLTGAAGNTAPSLLDPYDGTQPWRGDVGVERSGLLIAGEAAKIIAQTLEPMTAPALRLAQTQIEIPLRPWPQSDDRTHPNWPDNEYYLQAARDWPQRLLSESPCTLKLNALRIGDAAICTNPAELFVEFGQEIKSHAPSRVTFISELTDGYCGYVPTSQAFQNGGYETWCAPSSQLVPQAGDAIVRATGDLLNQVFES